MKYRQDFVTNSSSSSYTVVYKVNDCKELREYMADEYGKYGARLLEECLVSGSKLYERIQDADDEDRWIRELSYLNDDGEYSELEIADDDKILGVNVVLYTEDGVNFTDADFLAEHIPSQFIEKIYEGEAD